MLSIFSRQIFQIALCASDPWGTDLTTISEEGEDLFFFFLHLCSFTMNHGPVKNEGSVMVLISEKD